MPKPLIPAVRSLRELRWLAETDERYETLLKMAAHNLGGKENDTTDNAYRCLEINALETNEEGVVDEINCCRSLVTEQPLQKGKRK